jgi:hypothetical protein
VKDVNRMGGQCVRIVPGMPQESARGILNVRFAHN